MKKKYGKNERYSVLKTVLRVATLTIATIALVVAMQNRRDVKWLQMVQDNVIETLMFKTGE